MKIGVRSALLGSILLAACASGPPRAPFRQLDSTSAAVPTGFRSPEKAHAMQGARIRDAVARGDLDGVHEASRALLQLILSTEQPAPQTTLGEVVAVTRRLESIADLRVLHIDSRIAQDRRHGARKHRRFREGTKTASTDVMKNFAAERGLDRAISAPEGT